MTRFVSTFAIMLCFALGCSLLAGVPLGSEFAYQGQLNQDDLPVNGTVDFQMTLWDDEIAGTMIGTAVSVDAVPVDNGLFSVELDFGADAFNGESRWLEIEVRNPAGAGPFTTLAPRQPLTATPYSLQTRGLFVDESGNVGIGNDSPASSLDIDGVLTVRGGTEMLDQVHDPNPNLALLGGLWQSFTAGMTGSLVRIDVLVHGTNPNPSGTLQIREGEGASGEILAVQSFDDFPTGSGAWVSISLSRPPFVESGQQYSFQFTTSHHFRGRNDDSYADGVCSVGGGSDDMLFRTYVAEDAAINATGVVMATRFVGDGSGLSNLPVMEGLWSEMDTDIYYNVGDVGIGTDNPRGALEILGDVVDEDAHAIIGTSPTAKDAYLTFYSGGQTSWHVGVDRSDSGMLKIGNTGSATSDISEGSILSITQGGLVGIGSTTPATELDVNGTVTAGAFVGDGSQLTNVPGDDLGNHTMTQNIVTQFDYLSHDGTDEGIRVLEEGLVRIDNRVTLGDSPQGTNTLTVGTSVAGDQSNPANYVARFRNSFGFPSPQGILALQFASDLNGEAGNGNWIQFLEGGTDLAGKIENNNNGNAQYESGGADYAEMLFRRDADEDINPGDIVGVYGGKIGKQTDGADWVMAISGNAVVVGNADYTPGAEELMEIVSFVGQVPVWVRGPVSIGDYIVASGNNDGTAVAIAPNDITPEQSSMIVGRAWQASGDASLKLVNTIVGLPEAHTTTAALARTVNEQVSSLQAENARLKQRMNRLESLFTKLSRD